MVFLFPVYPHLFLWPKQWQPQRPSCRSAQVYLFMTIINFEPSAPAVEEQLLTATVRHESEALQQDHDALTQQLADRRGRLQVVVWHESASIFFYNQELAQFAV